MTHQRTPDAAPGLIDRLPPRLALYARLGRFDRPIGTWLLFWPCLVGAFMTPLQGIWSLWPLFLIGAVVMRAAGCVYNDIVDRDLDRKVWRTASRPLASGAVSVRSAWVYLIALSLIGLLVLLTLPGQAQLVALASLLLVAAYPFMKRITWWPQAWLGLTFNWGLPVGWAAADPALRADWPVMAFCYVALVCWTLGYDTIYAAQDMEDDELAGVKSSARALGPALKRGVAVFYVAMLLLLGAALWLWTGTVFGSLCLLPLAAHLGWQVTTLDPANHQSALFRFRSNSIAGLLLVIAILLAGLLVSA